MHPSLSSRHTSPFHFTTPSAPVNELSQATATVDFNLGDIVVGPGFWWSDVSVGRTLKVFGNMCRVPALSDTFSWFATDSLLFLAMLWYFDHVLPSTDGHTHNPLFFLNVFYWFPQLRRSRATFTGQDNLVTVSNLGKSYSTGFLGFGKPVDALNNVSFEVKRGTCLGLLGHNGMQSHRRCDICSKFDRCWQVHSASMSYWRAASFVWVCQCCWGRPRRFN